MFILRSFGGGDYHTPVCDRLEDLGPGDLVHLECVCGHREVLTASMLSTAGVRASDKLVDLLPECEARGQGEKPRRTANGTNGRCRDP